ncbi:MAG: hypothetical protein ABI457_07270 [Hyphomicrobium sp.]|jgi:hypothetical protein
MRTTASVSVLVIAALLGATSAHGEAPPFVGTWSLDPTNCNAGQETQNAPLVIAKDRYDQHESHCTFKSVEAKDSDWKITSDCTVEGSATPYDFALTVSGDTLTFTDSGGARDFLRCK